MIFCPSLHNAHECIVVVRMSDEPLVNELVFNFLRDSPGRGVELTRGFLRSNNVIVTREHVRNVVRTLEP